MFELSTVDIVQSVSQILGKMSLLCAAQSTLSNAGNHGCISEPCYLLYCEGPYLEGHLLVSGGLALYLSKRLPDT